MSQLRSGPRRRPVLGVALVVAGVCAGLAGVGVTSFGVDALASAPSPSAVPAAPPAAPGVAAAAPAGPAVPMPWALPETLPATDLPWAAELPPTPTPEPTPEAGPPAEETPGPAAAPAEGAGFLAASRPVHVRLARLGIDSDLMTLGLNPDGTVEVPPSARDAPAGWYDGSVTPGELGPSVILGHVDSVYGRGVFYDLRDTRPGDRVEVTREDGVTVAFTVDRVRTYPKSEFPTEAVYGDLDHAGLRLITCGGEYVKGRGGYQSNVVVFASMA